MRWVLRISAGLVVLVLLAAAGAWVLLPRLDLGPLAAGRIAARLGRATTIGTLHVTPGRWLRVELHQARIDNVEGGTRPAMVEIATATAEIDARSLLHGPLLMRGVVVDGLDVVLEHGPDGQANWKFGPGHAPGEKPSDKHADRAGFPTLLDARITGRILFRTRSGTELPIGLDGVTLATTAPDQPVKLAGPGSYRGVPIELDCDLASFAALRDAATPFPADIQMGSGQGPAQTRLRFVGTMTAPLDLDGARGRLLLDAPTPEILYRVAGASLPLEPALRLEGALEHDGPLWKLTETTGHLGDAAIEAGTLAIEEGQPERDVPDKVAIDLRFDQLDLNALLRTRTEDRSGADMSLAVARDPKTLLDAHLQAKSVRYGSLRLTDVALQASQKPARVAIDGLALTYLGGRLEARGQVDAEGEGGRVAGEVDAKGIEAQALRAALELDRLPLSGRLDGRVIVQGAGPTLNQAARTARASAVLTMAGGSIAREIVELASTNPLALLRKAPGTSAIACALGVLDVRAGVGTVAPLRIRTADGTIAAHGTVDLVRHRVDLTVASESATTAALALDVPVRVSGPFADPSIAPAQLSAAGRAQLAANDEPNRLLPALQPMAKRSPCLGRRP